MGTGTKELKKRYASEIAEAQKTLQIVNRMRTDCLWSLDFQARDALKPAQKVAQWELAYWLQKEAEI